MSGLVVDLFAGGGGASVGIEAALRRKVDLAVNHDAVALAVHAANHPETTHLTSDIWEVRPMEATWGKKVDLLWASPDCTHFSVAKGGKPRKQSIRSLAWVVCRWAKAVRPSVICLENVAEFKGWGPLDKEGKPIKLRKGETFKRWKRQLERLGYVVDYRVLVASHYGAPTSRKRLFLVARCDGQPIMWPERTHGPGLLPFHTAAECIDFSIPCPSIFERKKPLADKTLWRIAQGMRRFVFDNPQPYIVGVGGRAGQSAPTGAGEPLGTVTAKNDRALVVPTIVKVNHGDDEKTGNRSHAVEGPLTTITARSRGHALATTTLVEMNHANAPKDVEAPLGVITTQHNRHNLVAASLVQFRHDSTGKPLDEPMPTITAGNAPGGHVAGAGHALGIAAATLVQTSYGEREGQAARALDLEKPLGTVVAQGVKHAAVTAFLAKHFGDRGQRPGLEATEPLATVTASDHHSLVAANLVKLRGECHSAGVDEPVPTLTSGGNHVAEVRAFLTAYHASDFSGGHGQDVQDPMRTVTTKDRLGLVTIHGTEYQIVDIGMRMLEPHELLAAQFGRFASSYDMSAARTKTAKVRLIGNSVCPEMAEAVVRAQFHGRPLQLELAA